jgi:hypothetical protein
LQREDRLSSGFFGRNRRLGCNLALTRGAAEE